MTLPTALVFFLLIGVDVAWWLLKNPLLGNIGYLLWMVSWVFIGILVIQSAGYLIVESWKGKRFLMLGAVLAHLIVTTFNAPKFKHLGGENTQEIGCALNNLQMPDRGYWGTCLFGYPARQLYVPALPTQIWGRKLWALNLGGSTYFLAGLVVFASAIRRYLDQNKYWDEIGGIAIGSIFHIYFFNHLLFTYEQGIFPFGLGLLTVGLFVHYLKSRQTHVLFLMGLSWLFLIFSYTPSLALFWGSVAGGVYLMCLERKNIKGLLAGAVIGLSVVSFAVSMKYRADVNTYVPGVRNVAQIMEANIASFVYVFFQPTGHPVASQLMISVFLLTLLLSLSLALGKKVFFVGLWCVLTILASISFKGYVYYGTEFMFHKMTVVFPVLIFILVYVLSKVEVVATRKIMVSAAVLVIVLGLGYQQFFLNHKMIEYKPTLVEWLIPRVRQYRGVLRIIDSDQSLISVHDVSQYFYPSLEIKYSGSYGESGCPTIGFVDMVVLSNKSGPCNQQVEEQIKLKPSLKKLGLYDQGDVKYDVWEQISVTE